MSELKQASKTYADYTAEQHTAINELIMLCSAMDGSSIDHLGGVFKLAIISGYLRQADSLALLKSDPYLMKIVIGGLKTDYGSFKKRQRGRPVSTREVFDALLHYEVLVRDDYLKYHAHVQQVMTHKPLRRAIFNGLPQEAVTAPVKPLFGGK